LKILWSYTDIKNTASEHKGNDRCKCTEFRLSKKA
jgi:hypothetical protein